MKGSRPSCALALVAVLVSCKSSGTTDSAQAYRLHAVPGPTERETNYSFARNSLAIRVHGELDDGAPVFHFQFQNMGAPRLTVHQAMFTIRGGNPPRPTPVLLKDSQGREVYKISILGHDDVKFEVRAADSALPMEGEVVVELRGVRDDTGEAGYDFDLHAELVPEEADGAKATKKPETDPDKPRREMKSTNQIETPGKPE